MGLTMKDKRKIAKEIAERYQKARKKEKSIILNEFVALTGYNRTYASYLLSSHFKKVKVNKHTVLKADVGLKIKRQRKSPYEGVKKTLIRIWEIWGCPCGKRLKPILPEAVRKLKAFHEIVIDKETETKLTKISASTIDRLLREEKRKHRIKGKSHTKPGTLLKNQIPIRTFSEWNEKRPGFFEIDLVGHEGGNPRGEFIQTLVAVDIHTGWTEIFAVRNKAQRWVFEAIDQMRKRLPFPLLGIDSDNGAEFINDHLYRYCISHRITFTRSRKHRKNDNCYVEQKNYSVVRRYVGYFRYDREEELFLLNELYRYLRLYINFFQPVMKQISKTRVGSKVNKVYDVAKTPYERVIESFEIGSEVRGELMRQYEELNPAWLYRQIIRLQNELIEMVSRKGEMIVVRKKIIYRKGKGL